ncbi:MAG: branched-chain amino acid ABC transporter permease [Deltaproteobacteria bacterium]|jgi:branched-chain amino acid transport system permease protein|nr:branched-chain amino acid ABC transporter permease [Deltaproteobacteria bacterium]
MSGFSPMAAFLQILVNGVLFGSMYGVAAIGLSLIFGTMQIIFIAQGAMMILAAYITYWIFTLTSVDPFFCFVLIIPIFLGIGWIFYAGLFSRVAAAGKNPSLLLAFGLMILLENLMSLAWTANTRAVTTSYTGMGLAVGNIQISFTRAVVFLISLLATGLVFFFMKKTLWGKAVRAASENIKAAALLGISPRRVSGITFSIGIALAGIAGVATATTYPFDPYFGFVFSLKALIAVAFGGIGSVGGAMFGGILLGVIESVSAYTISGGWADAISYGAFLLVLMFRPQGIFGRSAAS